MRSRVYADVGTVEGVVEYAAYGGWLSLREHLNGHRVICILPPELAALSMAGFFEPGMRVRVRGRIYAADSSDIVAVEASDIERAPEPRTLPKPSADARARGPHARASG